MPRNGYSTLQGVNPNEKHYRTLSCQEWNACDTQFKPNNVIFFMQINKTLGVSLHFA